MSPYACCVNMSILGKRISTTNATIDLSVPQILRPYLSAISLFSSCDDLSIIKLHAIESFYFNSPSYNLHTYWNNITDMLKVSNALNNFWGFQIAFFKQDIGAFRQHLLGNGKVITCQSPGQYIHCFLFLFCILRKQSIIQNICIQKYHSEDSYIRSISSRLIFAPLGRVGAIC